ncbi:MAG: TetR/AcrR family transcriptional regulator [Proteobacteria bacterium]|nr:TetR/AcrR family transcriptional regulator [Pseudomonadota bacterium]
MAVSRSSTREQLLVAGREIVLKRGFQDLTVREVAASAGANLGSFVYHFGTRDAFMRALLEDWYAPLMSRVSVVADSSGTAIDRLRRAILQLVDFGAEQDVFMGRLLMAAATGERAARDFVRSLAGRHPRLLLRLVEEAQRAGALVEEHPLQVLCFLMASVGLPRLLASAWHGPPLFDRTLSATLSQIARDRGRIAQRLDWAIRGLAP